MLRTSAGLFMTSTPAPCTERLPGATSVWPFMVSEAPTPVIVRLPLPPPSPVAPDTVTGALITRLAKLPWICPAATSWIAPVVPMIVPVEMTSPETWQLRAPTFSLPHSQ